MPKYHYICKTCEEKLPPDAEIIEAVYETSHKLVTDDPYAGMRVPGEVDDLKVRLPRGGQHNPKPIYSLSSKPADK